MARERLFRKIGARTDSIRYPELDRLKWLADGGLETNSEREGHASNQQPLSASHPTAAADRLAPKGRPWQSAMQDVVSRILSSRPYKLPNDLIPDAVLKKNVAFYKDISR